MTNKHLRVPRRRSPFLSIAPNIAGGLLALGGLGLFFAGFLDASWWLIVGGLYGAGVLGWPRKAVPQIAQETTASTEKLAQQIHHLVSNVGNGLPMESLDALRSIQDTLNELLPRLMDLENRGVISAKDSFNVLETVRRYLPDTLTAYLRLPKTYAKMQPLADGRTASQTLLEQLGVLNMSLKTIAKNAFMEMARC